MLDSFLTEKFPLLSYQKMVLPGPQYLISDDPEYIRMPEAVALREKVNPGSVRLYLYNVNGVKEPAKMERKIGVVIRNLGRQPLHLRFLKFSSQKPTTNYFLSGKQGLADYFASKPSDKTITIPVKGSLSLDPGLEKSVVTYDELAHGIYEFAIDQPADLSVVQTAPETSLFEANNRIKEVAPSRHMNAGRGVYGVANYDVRITDTIDLKNGVRQLILADGKLDPWVMGIDGSSGAISKLAGNYGVMYQVKIPWRPQPGYGLALITWNSRAGDNKWCGAMANTMVVSGGKFPAGIIPLPSDRLNTKKSPEAVLVQVFTPEAGKEIQQIELTYSPPGASCLPTPLVLVPVKL